jgi:acetolactate synthase I/II/III large subunit
VNGAESLVRTLLASGIDTCFANPGTSEMHFVAALDQVKGMRCVLGMAETVVTAAADGYARMSGAPAATLLHCGPGFANGIANIHNARRAFTPMVNIVGDHATYHTLHDPPLAADTEGLARAASHWVRKSKAVGEIGDDGAAAVQAARSPPGQIATLILPADVSWNDGAAVGARLPVPAAARVPPERIRSIAGALRSREPAVMVLSGAALTERGLAIAQRIADSTGARLLAPTQVARMARGRGRPRVDRIPYVVDRAVEMLAGTRHVILVAAKPPTAFFAYPGKPSLVYPPDAQVHTLANVEEDVLEALEGLSDEVRGGREGKNGNLDAPHAGRRTGGNGPAPNSTAFDPVAFAHFFAPLIPENAIVMEEAVTSGRALFAPTFDAAPHDWIQITGGAIGQGFPTATGAAIACPDRKVVCLEADGSGMYSLQALWTQAREKCDVVNVVFANRTYRILQGELKSVGASPGPASNELFDLARPALDWTKLAEGMGVEAVRVEDMERFADAFRGACARRGPFLIELVI